MADRIQSLDFAGKYYAGRDLQAIRAASTYAADNLSVFNSDKGWFGNENESRTIAEILLPAVNKAGEAYQALVRHWYESQQSSPAFWSPATLTARVGEEVSKAFAARSLSYVGNLGDIYCDQFFMRALTAWNQHRARFSQHLTPAIVATVDEAFTDLNIAYQAAKAHCASIANS